MAETFAGEFHFISLIFKVYYILVSKAICMINVQLHQQIVEFKSVI